MVAASPIPSQVRVVPNRVVVRPWQRRDRRQLSAWPQLQQPEHWSDAAPSSGARLSFAVDREADGLLVGRITLRDMAPPTARLGMYLHPDFVGKGYGSAALDLFCHTWIGSVGITRLQLDVAADNERAVWCYRKCGFRLVAVSQRSGHDYYEMERGIA